MLDLSMFPRDINVKDYVMRPAFLHIKEKLVGRPLVGAEIGVYLGETAEYSLRNLNLKEYVMIDPYAPYGDMARNQEEWDQLFEYMRSFFLNRSNVNIVRRTSEKAAALYQDNYFDFVYIDGDHSYEAVEKDLNMWYNKVKSGGVLCGHDLNNLNGVMEAVTDFINRHKLCLYTGVDWYTGIQDWWVDK